MNIVMHCRHLRSFCMFFLKASRGQEILDGSALPWLDTFYLSTRMRNMRIELPTLAYRRTNDDN
jgi:hypothetical protein